MSIAVPYTGEQEVEAVRGPLESGWLTQGPSVAAFEQRFASRHEVGHALATTSCTTALELALAALGVGTGDEVIVPAFTWVATANVVRLVGAVPVFADVDERTFNIRPDEITRLVTPRTRAVIPVHLFGLCVDIEELRAGLPAGVAIVEDAACAVGASIRGRFAGGLGDVGAFSFHPRKIITTGEGGMLTTNDDSLAERVERLRNHGAAISEEIRHHGAQPYLLPDFDEVGFNFRMTDLQGAIGVVQMDRLDGLLEERRRWATWYGQQLADIPWLSTPIVPDGVEHSWQSYVTVVDEARSPGARNEIMARLHEHGVSTRPGTHTVPTLGAYRSTYDGTCPVAERLERTTMSIPLHNRMTEDDFDYVVEALRNC